MKEIWNESCILSPSLICLDMCNLEREVKTLENNGIKMLHVDILDGHFSPSMPLGLDTVRQLRAKTDLFFDCHVMVTEQDFFVDELLDIGVDQIVFHGELRYLHHPDLPDSECSLRELPDSFRRHSGRTVRSAGFVHSGQAHRTGEQHLPPDGSYHDYRSVVENRDSDYGVRGRPPQVGHEPLAGRLLGRQSPSASYPDDRADLRVRYDPAGNRNGCGRQR